MNFALVRLVRILSRWIAALLAILLLAYGGMWLAAPESLLFQTERRTRLPERLQIGQWLLTEQEVPASWLGQKVQGKTMREPINIILIDEVAKTPEAAVQYLLESCDRIGYRSRRGHSSDYRGQLGNRIYLQLPRERNHAFSNAFYILPNNHGRIFGPYSYYGKYYFAGAFSREGINLFAEVRHVYVSFEMAKQDFAARIEASGRYEVAGAVDMGSALTDHESLTTGDHDGTALVLQRKK